jgi:hypothetical protein
MPRQKKTETTEDLPDLTPPWKSERTDGTVNINRIDPHPGFLDNWPAVEWSLPRIKEAFGGGTYGFEWIPPESAELPRETHRQSIQGKTKTNGDGGANVADLIDRVVAKRLAEATGNLPARIASEYGALLELQRDESQRAQSAVISQMGEQSKSFADTMQAMLQHQSEVERQWREREAAQRKAEAESAEARRIEERERSESAAQREMERIRAHSNTALQLVQQSNASNKLDDVLGLVRTLKDAGLIGGLGGDGAKSGWEVAALALPGFFKGMGEYAEKASSATVRVEEGKIRAQLAAAGVVMQQPAALPNPSEPTNGADHEKSMLISWLNWMAGIHEDDWKDIIKGQWENGTLPTLIVEPLKEGIAGNPAPLFALLTDVGAEELIPRLAAVVSKDAATPDPEVGSPSSP